LGGKAMALIRIDNPISHEDIKQLAAIKNIVSVKAAQL